MADGGISTALIVSLAASSASTGAGLLASRQQQKSDLAMLDAETQRAKLAATDEAIVRAKGFREALASQLAISSLRSGSGGSLVRQFGAVSVSNFLKDQDVLSRRKDFIDIASQSNRAQIRASRFGRDINSIGSLVSSGVQSVNLNAFGDALK